MSKESKKKKWIRERKRKEDKREFSVINENKVSKNNRNISV